MCLSDSAMALFEPREGHQHGGYFSACRGGLSCPLMPGGAWRRSSTRTRAPSLDHAFEFIQLRQPERNWFGDIAVKVISLKTY